jgi:outer membrane protein TolC
MRNELLPLSQQRIDAALAAYRGGTGPLSAVLDARRARLDARIAILNMELAAAKAWAWLANVVVPEGQS